MLELSTMLELFVSGCLLLVTIRAIISSYQELRTFMAGRQRSLEQTKLSAEAVAIQARAETLRAGLAALEADWCQEAQSHFRTAERQEDEFAKRFCQNGGTCYANCVIGLRELLARVDGAGDLRAQAVEQDAKRP